MRRFLEEMKWHLPLLWLDATRRLRMGRYCVRAVNKKKVDVWVV